MDTDSRKQAVNTRPDRETPEPDEATRPSAACERVRARLDELCDRTLTPVEAARDAGHLEACDACAVEHRRLLALYELAHEALAPRAEELEALLDGLGARLDAVEAPRRPRLQLLGGARVRAAALVAAALALLLALQASGAFDATLSTRLVETGRLVDGARRGLPSLEGLMDGWIGGLAAEQAR